MSRLNQAYQKVSRFFSEDEYAIQVLHSYLKRIQDMPGANRILIRIASVNSKEQLEDYLAEVTYALIFAGLGFLVEIEPLGKKGPDLRISRDGNQAIVEIMRFNKVRPGPPVLDLLNETTVLSEYGNPVRDTRKAFEKIVAKFPQIGSEEAIIAIWNDEGDLEEIEVEMAVSDLCRDGAQNILSVPNGLLFILYGSWARPNNKQLHCFQVHCPTQPYQVIWARELESALVIELIRQAFAQSPNGNRA